MKQWAFYSLTDGRFTGQTFSSDDLSMLKANTPAGSGAIEGEFDRLSQSVDVKTLDVVDYRPPQPDDDHEWDSTEKRWVLTRDASEQQVRDRAARSAISLIEEKSGPRAVREALLLVLPDGDEKVRLAAFDAEIEEHRKDIATEKDPQP